MFSRRLLSTAFSPRVGAVRHAGNYYVVHPQGKVMGSTDGAFEKDRIIKKPGEANQRDFTYFMLGGARFIYASTVRLLLVKFVASMQPSADVLALASAEFNLSGIVEGTTLTVKWRGKPVFIRHRTDEEIAKETAVSMSSLKDPQPDAVRVQDPKWLLYRISLSQCTVALHDVISGWLCSECAPTLAVCLFPARGSTAAGSAPATALTMMPRDAFERAPRHSISKCLLTSWMGTSLSSVKIAASEFLLDEFLIGGLTMKITFVLLSEKRHGQFLLLLRLLS